MTVSDLALPNGKPLGGVDSPRVSTRARARIPATDRSVQAKAVGTRIVAVVGGDLLSSWMLADSTPTIRAYLAAEHAAPAPYGRRWLRWARLGWAYSLGLVGTVAGHVLAHLFQSPLRLAVAAVSVGVPIFIWQLGGMP